ncbi:MAG TPA: diaminobutyrate acetyltransferase [Gammaproteobacteria bacterium]|nr:diaminobutyrate acetyltransferase [Gammaproteobacteria bacterium]
MEPNSNDNQPVLRRPNPGDGKAVYELIQANPPLDVNTVYLYYLLCRHFADTCAVAEVDGQVLGFLSAYRIPNAPERLFIWQAAVDPALRGHGMAGRLLEEVVGRPEVADVRYLDVTVSPSNTASRRVFEKFAQKRGAGWHEEVFLNVEDFGSQVHEEELLFRIGPL